MNTISNSLDWPALRLNSLALLLIVAGPLLVSLAGCAEGPLWRTGYLAPWAYNKWAEENQIAETLFSRRQKLQDAVAEATSADLSAQEKMAQRLTQIIRTERIDLLRLEAARLLPELHGPAVLAGLEVATLDALPDVRIAAIRGLATKADPKSVSILARLLESDASVDVRTAATRALANFQGPETLQVLNAALQARDPAIQLVAMTSLEQVTGESLEPSVIAWQNYLASRLPADAGNSEDQSLQFR